MTDERPMVLRPMLAKAAAGSKLIKFCEDDRYWADQKIDGHRLLIHAGGGLFHPSSRTGMTYPVSAEVQAAFAPFIDSDTLWIFDGEYIDRTFWIFDLPEVVGQVSCDDPFEIRRTVLEGFFASWSPAACVQLVPIAKTTEEKAALARKAMESNAEGVMFKLRTGKYREGKRCEDILKVKFRFDIDCIVTELGRGRNDKGDIKNNFVASIYRDGALVEVGECTRGAGDGAKVVVGDVVTIKILYVTEDDRLYQPTAPKIRKDKRPADCTWDQLATMKANKRIIS